MRKVAEVVLVLICLVAGYVVIIIMPMQMKRRVAPFDPPFRTRTVRMMLMPMITMMTVVLMVTITTVMEMMMVMMTMTMMTMRMIDVTMKMVFAQKIAMMISAFHDRGNYEEEDDDVDGNRDDHDEHWYAHG